MTGSDDVRNLNKMQEELDRIDRETADDLIEGGPVGLKRLRSLFDKDRAGFEAQIFKGRESVTDPKVDELIALRAYAERWTKRIDYYLEVDKARHAGKIPDEKA